MHLYQQLYCQIKDKILSQQYHPHDRLPSKRALAKDLNLSINTVTNAYDQLQVEGYIYTVERSGYYVEPIAKLFQVESEQPRFPKDLYEKVVDRKDWLSFSHMATDGTRFPIHDWLKCEKQAIKNHLHELGDIAHPQGPYIIRKSIAELIRISRGVLCEPEQIVLSTGTQPLMKQFIHMLEKQPTVAMEDPGYARMYTLLSHLNIPIETISLDENGINIEQLVQSEANLAFVTPAHQFPMGTIMPISRRVKLLNWAVQQKDHYILEDDYDSEYKYKTDHIPALQSLDRHEKVVYFGTFSKTLLPSLRISYMVLPPHLLRIYRQVYTNLIPYNHTLSLFTLHYFLESGLYHRHIRKMSNEYSNVRELLIEQLMHVFHDRISIHDTYSGLHFLVTIQTNRSYDDIEAKAKELQLELYTLRRFLLEKNQSNQGEVTLIIGFAKLQADVIYEAVQRLYAVVFN